MKSTEVDESLSTTTTTVLFQRKPTCFKAKYFDLDKDIIKQNCKFKFFCKKTVVTLTVLDGGNEIILANWPNDKNIICTINNDIPITIKSHPYILVNGSVLCNCVLKWRILSY